MNDNNNTNSNMDNNNLYNKTNNAGLIGTHQTSIYMSDNNVIVRYWNTNIVTITNDSIILNIGGWYTSTTKRRMNQASNQFNLNFYVYQKDYNWYCELTKPNGKKIIFCFQQNTLTIPKDLN